MARARSPNRDRAFKIWEESKGTAKLKDIAAELGCSPSQVRKWKNQDEWDAQLKGNVTIDNGNVTNQHKKKGAPKHNKNAVGNNGGSAPKGNSNAVTHGFFRTIFPEDEETMQIVEAIQQKSPVDMIWENIVIKYTAIARAQKLMFVKNQDDTTREIKKMKGLAYDPETEQREPEEIEYELQFAWDKHATFLNAQSRAMGELRSLIKDFLVFSGQDDMRRAQLEKMQHDMKIQSEQLAIVKAKHGGDEEEYEDDGFLEALDGKTKEVWADEKEET
ncbi:phage terminase small subunit [Bacillus suaedae]|uniref:PBSX phage terminase small subunit-like N-terminal domain-containing protein n=1 Tax=Halalkalibacter suaedae TaxID=2822140 RepID=A0A940WTG1_9BACI|nr:phage terminase small subunit [Bacillus suaedae]MBP3950327.1 hypothetical protein [Bacillus suaedae]